MSFEDTNCVCTFFPFDKCFFWLSFLFIASAPLMQRLAELESWVFILTELTAWKILLFLCFTISLNYFNKATLQAPEKHQLTSNLLAFWKPPLSAAELNINASSFTESRNHRTVGVGRDLWGSPRAGCTGPRPGGSWISPEKEIPQPPWAACARAPSPSEGRSSSSSSDGTSCASVCAHCPLSCHWAPLKRAWPHPPDPHPAGICRHW